MLGHLSECQPILLSNGYVVWYYTGNPEATHYYYVYQDDYTEPVFRFINPYNLPEIWPFRDVEQTSGIAADVKYSYEKGIISGFSQPDEIGQVTFKPNNSVTRAQFAIMLYKMAGSPNVSEIDADNYTYRDVSAGMKGYDEVKWASANGIITGFSDGRFKPNNPISRSQIAIMLKKYADYMKLENQYDTGGQNIDTFEDCDEIKTGADESLQWAIDNGIISGVSPTKLKPNGFAGRGQCAAFCARFYRKFLE